MALEHMLKKQRDEMTVMLPASRYVRTNRFTRFFAWTLCILGSCFLLFLFAPWQQTSEGFGRVIAFNPQERIQRLGAPIKGRVSKWYVTEGSVVKKGQIIALMSDLDPMALKRIEQQRNAVVEQRKLAKLQAKAYERKISSLKQAQKLHFRANQLKIRMTRQKYRTYVQKKKSIEAALKIASINQRRLKRLRKDSIVSKRYYELASLKVVKLQMSLESAKADLLTARSQIVEARAQQLKKNADDLSKISSAEAELEKARDKVASALRKIAAFDLKTARQNSQVIRAMRDSVVLQILVAEGSEMLKAGDFIAILVPNVSKFAVELWVDGNDAPLLSRGRHVRLQFEGWPAVQFAGWPSVAVGTFGGVVSFVDVTNHKNGKFRVVVVPDAKDDKWPAVPFLKQGMKTKGWILLEQVRLGYELWRLLNRFPQSVSAPKKEKTKKSKKKKGKV